jgi:hypothetical protein
MRHTLTIAVASVAILILTTPLFAGEQDCGAYALRHALSLVGKDAVLDDLRKELLITPEAGTSLLQIKTVAQARLCSTQALRLTPTQALTAKAPWIAFVRKNHFVTIAAADSQQRRLLILDEGREPVWQDIKAFSAEWNGEALLISAPVLPKQPRLWIHSDTITLGKLRGTTEEHRYWTILNTGARDLQLSEHRFTCSCASLTFDKKIIPPGGYAIADLKIDTAAKPNGPFQLGLAIKTNEGEDSWRRLTLEGMVQRDALIYPSYFSVGDVPPDKPIIHLTSKLFLGRTYQGPVPTFIDTKSALRGASIQQVDNEPGAYDLTFSLDTTNIPVNTDGRFFQDAYIRCGDLPYPAIQIGATGTLLPLLTVHPPRVFIAAYSPGIKVERSVRLVRRTSALLNISVDKPESVQVTVDGDSMKVVLTLPDQTVPFQGKIHIKIDDTPFEIPVLALPVSASAVARP